MPRIVYRAPCCLRIEEQVQRLIYSHRFVSFILFFFFVARNKLVVYIYPLVKRGFSRKINGVLRKWQ